MKDSYQNTNMFHIEKKWSNVFCFAFSGPGTFFLLHVLPDFMPSDKFPGPEKMNDYGL